MNSIFARILVTLERILASNASAKDIAEIKASQARMEADVALIREAIFNVPPPPPDDGELSQLADAAERSAHKLEGVASELDKLDNE